MKFMNLGSGPDFKEAREWINVDVKRDDTPPGTYVWDARTTLHSYPHWVGSFDFVLINHVLCTMTPDDVKLVLENVYELLVPNGQVVVIDVDIIKAFHGYKVRDRNAFPIYSGSMDYKLCMHLSGFGTRRSLYTSEHLRELLIDAGFSKALGLSNSPYDTRPAESLIVKGFK